MISSLSCQFIIHNCACIGFAKTQPVHGVVVDERRTEASKESFWGWRRETGFDWLILICVINRVCFQQFYDMNFVVSAMMLWKSLKEKCLKICTAINFSWIGLALGKNQKSQNWKNYSTRLSLAKRWPWESTFEKPCLQRDYIYRCIKYKYPLFYWLF